MWKYFSIINCLFYLSSAFAILGAFTSLSSLAYDDADINMLSMLQGSVYCLQGLFNFHCHSETLIKHCLFLKTHKKDRLHVVCAGQDCTVRLWFVCWAAAGTVPECRCAAWRQNRFFCWVYYTAPQKDITPNTESRWGNFASRDVLTENCDFSLPTSQTFLAQIKPQTLSMWGSVITA